MNPTLQFVCLEKDKPSISNIINILNNSGYHAVLIDEFDENNPVIFCLSKDMNIDDVFMQFPWLKNQYEFSSIKHLIIMPFIAYHGKSETVNELWEEGIGDLYEEIFSGEFKPYGWDLDDPSSLIEFKRVLEEYL